MVFGNLSDLTITLGGSGAFVENSGVPLDIILTTKKGQWHVSWDGTNDLGNAVTLGTYILKSEVNQSGNITVFLNSITVTSLGNQLSISIYTPSGELVKVIYQGYSTSGELTGIALSSNLLLAGSSQNGTVGIGALGDSGLYLSDSGGSLTPSRITWDGTTGLGNMVQNGEFIIKAEQIYHGGRVTFAKSVTVLQASTNAPFGAKAYPNPYRAGGTQTIYFKVDLSQSASLRINIYNLAGNLIITLRSPGGMGTQVLPWDVNAVASGVYIAAVEAQPLAAGPTFKTAVKVVIIK